MRHHTHPNPSLPSYLLACLCLVGLLIFAGAVSGETLDRATAADTSPGERANDSEAGKEPSTTQDPKTQLLGVGFVPDINAAPGPASEAPCIEEPVDPLPLSSCYSCITIEPANPACPITIRCGEATSNGRRFCSITIGGGSVKCETTGAHCTTV